MGVLVLEAADLLGGGLLEGFLHRIDLADLGVLAHFLVDPVQDGLLAGFQLLEPFVLGGLVPVKGVVGKLDEGDELSVALHHEGFLHAFDVVDHLLDLLRVDVLAGGTQDGVVQTALDVVMAGFVHGGDVVGMEPSFVIQDLEGTLGILVVAQHHVVAADDDFAFAVGGIHVVQPDIDLVGGDADGAEMLLLVHHDVAHERGGFGEAIADGVGELALDEELFHRRIQLGAADAEECELATEGLHHPPADEPAQDAGDVLVGPGEDTAFLDRGEDAVLDHLFDDERDGAHDGGPDLLHRGEKDGGSRRFLERIAGRAHIEGIQRGNAHLIGVGGRQDAQETVFLEGRLGLEGGRQVAGQVAVAEHHALGLPGGAGGVDDAGQVVRRGILHPSVALEIFLVLLEELEGLDVDDQGQFLLARFAELRKHALGDEDGLGFRVVENVGEFVFRTVGEDGDRHAAEGRGGEERYDPVGHVLREDGYAVAVLDPEAGHPLGQTLGLRPEIGVRILLAAVHELIGDAFRIVGGGVVKDLVKGRTGVLAVSVSPPGFVGTLDSLCHVSVRFVRER